MKAPKGKAETPWSLHMRSFWKILFINSPEVRGQVVRCINYGKENDDVKISKCPTLVNRKIAEGVPIGQLPKSGRSYMRGFESLELFATRKGSYHSRSQKYHFFPKKRKPRRKSLCFFCSDTQGISN
jgi:hypothetical protein